jgi:hypothetical protein
LKWTIPSGKLVLGATVRLSLHTATTNTTLPFQFESGRSYRISSTGCALTVKAAGIDIPKEQSSMPKRTHLSTHNKKDHQERLQRLYNDPTPTQLQETRGSLLVQLTDDFRQLIEKYETPKQPERWQVRLQVEPSGRYHERYNGKTWVRVDKYPVYLGDNRFLINVEGQVLNNVHYPTECGGRGCVIHHPSTHPLVNAPLRWQNGHLLRVCSHGLVHWDADDIAYQQRRSARTIVLECRCDCNCCGLSLL